MTQNDLWISDVLDDNSNFNSIFNIDNELDSFKGVQDSQYYTEDEYVNLIRDKDSLGKKLKIISLNIANIFSKLSSLKTMLQNLTYNTFIPNIIVVTETHIQHDHGRKDHDLINLIPGYEFFHVDRKRKGGGVGIFIDSNICKKSKPHVKNIFYEGIFEGMAITIPSQAFSPNNKKDLVILGVYRPPGNNAIDQFLTTLQHCMRLFDKKSNELILAGDLNLDLLKYQLHKQTADYIDILVSHQMLPYIVRPTRIKHSSATLIDHIFMKGNRNVVSGILATEIAGSHGYTDHFPVFCIIDLKIRETPGTPFVKRYFTSDGHRKRREGLVYEDWSELYQENDPNTIYDSIQSKYCSHYNQNLTSKTYSKNNKRLPREPWMTHDLLSDIRKRNKLVKQKDKLNEYKQLRNDIVKRKRKAEKNYYEKKINECWKDLKGMWNILKMAMNQVSNKTSLPTAFNSDGKWISDKKENANNFNEFYSNVGPKANASIPGSQKTARQYLEKSQARNAYSIFTPTFRENDIKLAAQKLNKKTSTDTYGVSQAIMIDDIEFLAKPLTHLMNCSITTGTCPDGSKISRVIPVYKDKGHNYLYDNYRPISLIPALSKIMERLICDKITEFLVRFKVLYKSQYGFRKNHNTTHATLDFLKTIESALEENEYGVGIFCDLSKAFDTLDHDILIEKLKHYGIRGPILNWICSYLKDRKQYVDLDGTNSGLRTMSVGVPQGSILGPLLFLIYVNDLPAALDLLRPIMFADDTNLVIKGKNLGNLKTLIQSELNELADFFKANRLKLNVGKTKLICFRKKGVAIDEVQFEICLNDEKIKIEDSASFLGMTIDCHLTWEKHCQEVSNKVSRTTGILGRLKNFLPSSALKTIYDSLFMSHVQYGLEVWGGNSASKGMKRLCGLQKKAIRHVTKSHYIAHTEPRMKSLGFLKVNDQHLLQCAKLAHDMVYQQCPENLQNSLNLCSDSHSYPLRSVTENPLEVREKRTDRQKIKVGFSKMGPKVWNSIPDNLKQLKSRNSFKTNLKQHIIKGYTEKLICSNPQCRDKRFHIH